MIFVQLGRFLPATTLYPTILLVWLAPYGVAFQGTGDMLLENRSPPLSSLALDSSCNPYMNMIQKAEATVYDMALAGNTTAWNMRVRATQPDFFYGFNTELWSQDQRRILMTMNTFFNITWDFTTERDARIEQVGGKPL
jgi:hypothetical protein